MTHVLQIVELNYWDPYHGYYYTFIQTYERLAE